jgi:hypothetical protein
MEVNMSHTDDPANNEDKLNGKQKSPDAKTRIRANIVILICGFLVGLTIKGSLDAAYSKLILEATTWTELWHSVVKSPSLQLLIFLFTLVRFVYGAYRVHEVCEEISGTLASWITAWNIPGTLGLFLLFYINGLSVHNATPFYASLIVVHLWDLAWFVVPTAFSKKIDKDLKSVMRSFLVIDVVTVALLAVALAIQSYLAIAGALIMIAMGIIDFRVNRKFYFDQNWRPAP